ncbi:AMP-binding protein, partial [Pseudomonas syringae]|nr:AMP-binding protein [Pseudomonas syringae]MBD8804154.1 AMP-binding protein [Pseudomonas syringae]
MSIETNKDLVRRFIQLPQDKRSLFLKALAARGTSLAQLPIPQTREAYAQLPLSYAQERQWFLWALEPGSCAYHIPVVLKLQGTLDAQALQRTLDALARRHDVLRTSFVQVHDRPVQKVHAPEQWPLTVQHLDNASDGDLQGLISAFIETPFDLACDPLLRMAVVRVSMSEHILVLVQHHIICDGVSMQIMVDELMQLYAGYTQGREASLAALPIQYADYAIWQRSWMEAGEKQRLLDYWLDKLGTHPLALALPYDHARPATPGLRGQSLSLDIAPALGQALMTLARAQRVTPFMLLLASFQVLLHRYSGQSSIRVGVPVANRNRVETERLLGFFVNTQVLQADVDGLMPFEAFVHQVSQDVLQAQAHQDLPYEQLVEALQPTRSLGQGALFQAMFNHQSTMTAAPGHVLPKALQVSVLPWQVSTTQFDLSLDTSEHAGGITASLTYAQDLFEPATVARMGEHWVNLLQAIVADPGQRIADLPLLSRQERERTVQAWNATAVEYPRTVCLHQLIEAQVRRAPQAVALTFEGRHLSYGELNARANRLAHRLIEAGVGPEVPVGIAMPRSLDMVVGLLAILKAGGAYVPLD